MYKLLVKGWSFFYFLGLAIDCIEAHRVHIIKVGLLEMKGQSFWSYLIVWDIGDELDSQLLHKLCWDFSTHQIFIIEW